jgi:predicted acyltransferase (DUF342 family)
MGIIVVFILLILMFVFPFMPGIIEYYRKTDAEPLFIPFDYSKDPRYFSTSFKRLLANSIDGLKTNDIVDITLSRKEKIEITADRIISSGNEIDHLLYIKGDLTSGKEVKLNMDVYVTGNASLGVDNVVQVLAVDGNITLGQGVNFNRWADAEGTFDISPNCDLGISATCGQTLRIAENCVFRRLYAMPIVSDGISEPSVNDYTCFTPVTQSPADNSFIREDKGVVEPDTEMNKNIVFEKSVEIGHNCIIIGNIKSYGDFDIKENVTIQGNVFADGNIRLGSGTIVLGNVFSQGSIYLDTGVKISRPNVIKSVIGKRAVTIGKGVIIYGFVATEGKGIII